MFNFGNTPPAPTFSDRLKDARAKAEAESAAIDFIIDMMLESEMLDSKKIELQIARETKKLNKKISESFLAFAAPVDDDKAEELFSVRKEVYEYIQLVNAGVDSFLAAHPAPPGALD